MGFLRRLSGRKDEALDAIARRTINFLKITERKDRKILVQDENRDFETETLLNKLEFSRRSCVLKYIGRLAKGRDVTPDLIPHLV